MNLRPLGYEPNELPGCSTPRQKMGETTTRLRGASSRHTRAVVTAGERLPCMQGNRARLSVIGEIVCGLGWSP